MNKRQAKQTAHAIVDNVLTQVIMDGVVHEYACGDGPHCGLCKRCRDVERIEAALTEIRDVHHALGKDHRDHES